MSHPKIFFAAAILAAVAVAPSLAQARTHYARLYGLPYEISYNHNYGPGPRPGTFTYYDGPSTVHCAQSAATYRGADGRRYPCN